MIEDCLIVDDAAFNFNTLFVTFLVDRGGSVAEWLERRTRNPEVTGSSPALTT